MSGQVTKQVEIDRSCHMLADDCRLGRSGRQWVDESDQHVKNYTGGSGGGVKRKTTLR